MAVLELLAASPALFVGTCVVLGLAIGSFLNVVIYRLPVMIERQWREHCVETLGKHAVATAPAASAARFDLVTPRSRCPSCAAPITAWQNIPILSWVILKGRCARCAARISARYPLIEALTGVLSGIVAQHFGFGWPALGALILTWFLIALAFIDIDHQLLPDDLTLPLLWLGLFFSLWQGRADGTVVPVDVRSSLIGAMAGYASLWSVYHLFRLVTGKEGMGYGDFKLFAALGAWLGWQMLLPIILLAAVAGALIGLALIALKGRHRSSPIPFGPFLAASGWLMLLSGPHLIHDYLDLFTAHP
jgi:leader peptidase (prepilin peptidase) / N-methyltransferase